MGLYIGGTGGSNHYDDYEEGTWTPTDASGSNVTITQTSSPSHYLKVGRFVMVTFDVTYGSTGSGSLARMQAPFSVENYGSGAIGWNAVGLPLFIHWSVSNLYIMRNNSGSGNNKHVPNDTLSGKRFIGTAIGYTTS